MSKYDTGGADVPRDQWGRPLVTPPGGGKPVGYTRATTVAGVLEDTFNLTLWKQRMVARGLTLRPDLMLRLSSLGPQPDDTDPNLKRWKDTMNGLCEAAMEAAEASAASTIGTALHALTDRLDRGQDVGHVPDQYLPHLKAYEEATKVLTVVHIERFLVMDEHRIGGTADRIVRVDGHPKLVIADTKSGKNIQYGLGKIEIQLAIYAHSVFYDYQTGGRAPIGDIDLERALVIALNANSGLCELHWVDIAEGWRNLQLAMNVRAHRAKKRSLIPFDAALPLTPTIAEENARDLTVEAAAALEVAIRKANSRDELIQLWTAAGNVWRPEHTELAEQRKHELAQQRHLTIVN